MLNRLNKSIGCPGTLQWFLWSPIKTLGLPWEIWQVLSEPDPIDLKVLADLDVDLRRAKARIRTLEAQVTQANQRASSYAQVTKDARLKAARLPVVPKATPEIPPAAPQVAPEIPKPDYDAIAAQRKQATLETQRKAQEIQEWREARKTDPDLPSPQELSHYVPLFREGIRDGLGKTAVLRSHGFTRKSGSKKSAAKGTKIYQAALE